MITPTSPSEQILFTTVRIETTLGSGAIGSGTGFFYEHKLDGEKAIPLIVTNKPVLYAGPQMNAEGKIVAKPIPVTFMPVSETKLMIHLGYVVKAGEIVVAAKAFETELKRQKLI